MVSARWSALLATAAVADLAESDLRRAKTPKPLENSQVLGDSPEHAFESMNRALQRGAAVTRDCQLFDHETLNSLARQLYSVRSTELDDIYSAKSDKRALHFGSLDYKERIWQGETAAAAVHPSHVLGGPAYNATRDGKCAELVMWFVHHLAEPTRKQLAASPNFQLPLMPSAPASEEARSHEYQRQTCTDCHVRIQDPTKPAIVTPAPRPIGSGPQFQEDCTEGLEGRAKAEAVFYNRTKRCDWDFEPFCAPCEGVGGLAWGNGEHEWNPMPCEVVMAPDDIPEENLTTPFWPEHFTVMEKAMLTFPGRDPCNVKFKNSTYQLVFDTTPEGPLYHTIGISGPSGPSPFPGKSWALPNGNFYNTVDIFHHSSFCICLSPDDPTVENALNGPLSYDFLKGAVLIGRERIVPEYLNTVVLADHWVKGPHHFWFDVTTNLMVREWQPFNGHQIYYDWDLSKPAEDVIGLEKLCYEGLLHYNVSCKAPPPAPPPAAQTDIVV
jgi:hypothetical protein